MRLGEKAQQCQLLQEQIEQLFQTELYSVEEAAALVAKLNTLLATPTDPLDTPAESAEFLQQNLDWLQKTMAKLSAQRDAVAESMLTIQKGRRARHSYGQHN
ncbi:hypothetical protein ABGI61_08040 [Rheinheimera sp. FR7-31]|uniref:hypothetical protein n=1 Tax=Rheinheimera fenheensis TaxID=3152295 RepID=UPI00325CA68D